MANDGDIAVNPRTGQRLEWQGGAEGGWGTPNIPIGRMGGPPLEPTTEQATQAAAQRQKDTVQPPGGRQEGSATGFGEEAPKGVPILGAAVPTTPAAKRLEEEHPLAAGAARATGGAISMLPMAATGPGAAVLGMGPRMLPNLVNSTASGAAIGGLDAAARGEDMTGGAIGGGVAGAVAPAVAGLVGRTIVKPIAEAIGTRLRPPEGALAGYDPTAVKMAKAMAAAEGLTPAMIDAKVAELGPHGFLLDYGYNFRNMAGGAAAKSGPALSQIRGAVGGRLGQAPQVIDQALTKAFGQREVNYPEYSRFLKSARKQGSDPLYARFRDTQVPMTPELEALLPRLEKAGALKEAADAAGEEGKSTIEQFFTPGKANSVSQGATFHEVPSAETWDYAKRGLDEVINKYKPFKAPGVPNPNASADRVRRASAMKSDLINALESHPNQEIGQFYREARQTYAEPTGIMTAFENGQNWKHIDKDELPYFLDNLGILEKKAFLQGARTDLYHDMINTGRGAGKVANQLAGGGEGRLALASEQKLNHMLGPESTKELVDEMERQKAFAATKGKISDNSETAARQSFGEDLAHASKSWVEGALHRMQYGFHVTPSTYLPGYGTLKEAGAQEARSREQEILKSLGGLLTTKNPDAAAVAKALLAYEHPGEAAGPMAGQIANVLSRGALQGEGVRLKQKVLP